MSVTGRLLKCCELGKVFCRHPRFMSSIRPGPVPQSHIGTSSSFSWSLDISKHHSADRLSLSNSKNFPLHLQSFLSGKHANILEPSVEWKGNKYILPPVHQELPTLQYISPFAVIEKLDPLVNDIEIAEVPKVRIEKSATRMLIIRRRKMKKHRRKKWLKKYKFLIQKIHFRKERKKEHEFQGKLIAEIQAANAFSAEELVSSTLKRIRERPRPETADERRERITELIRKNRSETVFVTTPPKSKEDD